MKNQPFLWQFEDAGHVILFRPVYVQITGSLAAGILLSQVVYWFKPMADGGIKLRMFRFGRYWIAKSQADWAEETCLGRDRFERACDLLAGMKIIQRKIFIWKGAPTNNISLNVSVLSKFLKTFAGNPQIQNVGKPANGFTGNPQINKNKITTEITAEISKGASAKADSKTKPTSKAVGQKQKGKHAKVGSKGAAPVDSHEVQKKLEEKKNPKGGHPTTLVVKTASELGKWWDRLYAYYYGGGVILKPLTGKQIGQLAKYMKAIGRERAYDVMHHTIRNWGFFHLDVVKLKGETTAQLPHVGALLKDWDVALAAYTGSKLQLTAPEVGTSDTVLLSDAEVEDLLKGGA